MPNNQVSSVVNSLPEALVNLIAQLIRSPSVVGAEHSFFRVLQRELEERGAKVTWYQGILVAQGNDPESLFFSAHIDRHGLICTGPNEFQYAAFVSGNRSGLLGNSVDEELMRKIVKRFPDQNVYAYEPWSGAYRGAGKVKHSYICPKRKNLIFELENLQHLVAGTPIAFADKLSITDDALIGQLDNVLTAAVLVYMFELGFQGTAFFTAEEECGNSWQYLLEWFLRFGGQTNQLVVVDTSPFPDFETAEKQDLVLRNCDANANFNQELTEKLTQICEKHNYSVTFKDEYTQKINVDRLAQGLDAFSIGSTEMGRIINGSNGIVDGTTLQIPTSGYHTMSESAPIKSVAAFLDIIINLAKLENRNA
ncbi:peptidase M42 [Pseudocolwellia sp. AS88]|uniref:peptidase M42 n=1 Tax=Pseudocolwellia sp. AS88 TaxID=3063958 RepID=UPI0026E91DDE|nr:peptidase M42 [Pseudocolwellia sp. AS88]MDO7086612.1 peptidase M42 [Pseudocolwellia sp. AS88]